MLGLLRNESVRLHQLVDNLTHLMRFEHGVLPIHPEKVELNEFVQAEIMKVQQARTTHKILFKPCREPIEANLDPLLFAQVIFNIIDNALEYTPLQGSIIVSTILTDASPRLVIEDDGPGIPEDQLEKIFEKYYRLSSRSRGAGLGLTVCRAIVEAHGARLWAENRSPRGLRLIVELKTH
jgi:two-component system sensor histidine kinase KdpD